MTETVGCWVVRNSDGEYCGCFSTRYPTFTEAGNTYEVTAGFWEVVQ